jgi:hypothetical protein
MRVLANKALSFIQPFKADFIIVGCDQERVFNALCGFYDSPYLKFEPADIDSLSSGILPTKPKVSHAITEDPDDDVEVLFEEKAVVLENTPDEYLQDIYDQEDFGYDEWRNRGARDPVQDSNIQSKQAAMGNMNSPDGVDYELDSFIVEDEGDQSLTVNGLTNHAVYEHNYPTTTGYNEPTSATESYSMPQFSVEHLLQYQHYSERPVTFIDMLLQAAKAANSQAENSSTSRDSASYFSFILANDAAISKDQLSTVS